MKELILKIETAADARSSILGSSVEYQASASQHRLNQSSKKLNPGLQAAAAKKESLLALKKLTKSESITVESTLYIFPLKGGNSKKVAENSIYFHSGSLKLNLLFRRKYYQFRRGGLDLLTERRC